MAGWLLEVPLLTVQLRGVPWELVLIIPILVKWIVMIMILINTQASLQLKAAPEQSGWEIPIALLRPVIILELISQTGTAGLTVARPVPLHRGRVAPRPVALVEERFHFIGYITLEMVIIFIR
jgi:hypothetical protein